MWDADNDDDALFERRMDNVVREIGDRGKVLLPEAVTPFREPSAAPTPTTISSPAPAPAPALVPNPVSAASPAFSATPSLRQAAPLAPQDLVEQPMASQNVTSTAVDHSSASLGDILAFIKGERDETRKERLEWQVAAKAERAALETKLEIIEGKLEDQRLTTERQRREMDAKIHAHQFEVVETTLRASRVKALQVRLEALYDANLLQDDEMSAIEDKVADAIGVTDTNDADGSAWGCVMQMIQLSEGIVSEKMFARQLRRKFV